MELAGVVLGGIPLLIYALDNYKRCLEPGKNYLQYSSTLGAIRSHVFVQQEQLDVTLRNIGLVKPTKAELRDHLWELYPPEKCSEFMNIIDKMERTIDEMMDKLDIDSQGKPRWAAETQDRVNWEWRRIRRSFGRKERDRLVADLQYWNTGLKNIFEKAEIPSDESDPQLAEMQARFNSKHCDITRQNLQLIHETLSSRWSCACGEHKGNIRLEWHASRTTVTDKVTLIMPSGQQNRWHTLCANCQTVVDDANTQPSTPTSTISILADTTDSGSTSPTSGNRPPSPSRLRKLKVLFSPSQERKRRATQHLTIPMTTPPTAPGPASGTISEISCLCTYTRPATQPRKSGYFPCASIEGSLARRVKIDCVSQTMGTTTAIPLQQFLSPTPPHQGPSTTPMHLSRKQRFSIAASIVWGLLYLCDSPWMSKDWAGKSQIHLFIEHNAGQNAVLERGQNLVKQPLNCPTLGYTFKSRPLRPQSNTQGPDPSVPQNDETQSQNTQQIRNKDLFSLGILLIELCLNKTFEQIRHEENVTQNESFSTSLESELTTQMSELGWPSSSSSFPTTKTAVIDDFELANRQIDKIYLEAGDQYGYAVQRCLRCEFPGRDVTKSFDFRQFRQNFFNGVVAPVQTTYLRQPGSLAEILGFGSI